MIRYIHPIHKTVVTPTCSSKNEFGNLIKLHGASNKKVPDLIWPRMLAPKDKETLEEYEAMADIYDQYAPLPFLTYQEDEVHVRNNMLDLLNLTPKSKVLEIGCGTGRGSELIQKRLNSTGLLVLQEISPKLLAQAIHKTSSSDVPTEFSLGNGSFLPFEDNFFDAAHHFGGINTFAEIPRCLTELARVVRPGGRVVVGDEGLGPWLKDTEFGKIMSNSNPLLKSKPPVKFLPSNTEHVCLRWILKGAFFLIDFTVTQSAPKANYHLKIPSARGGSHWTRFYGNLEGVSDEAKILANDARKKAGISMHDWLDKVIKETAVRQIKQK